MNMEFVIVHFPRKNAYYRVPINRVTEEAIWRLEINDEGYYELIVKSDEACLWKYARPVMVEEPAPTEVSRVSRR